LLNAQCDTTIGVFICPSSSLSIEICLVNRANIKKRLIARNVTFATGCTWRKRKTMRLTSLRKSDFFFLFNSIHYDDRFCVSQSGVLSSSSRKLRAARNNRTRLFLIISMTSIFRDVENLEQNLLNVIRRVSIVTNRCENRLENVSPYQCLQSRWFSIHAAAPLSSTLHESLVLHSVRARIIRACTRISCVSTPAKSFEMPLWLCSYDRIRHRSRRSRPYQRQE